MRNSTTSSTRKSFAIGSNLKPIRLAQTSHVTLNSQPIMVFHFRVELSDTNPGVFCLDLVSLIYLVSAHSDESRSKWSQAWCSIAYKRLNTRIGPFGKLERFCFCTICEQFKNRSFQTNLEGGPIQVAHLLLSFRAPRLMPRISPHAKSSKNLNLFSIKS